MNKIEAYVGELRRQPDWDHYLQCESGLPGPRGNLELAAAVARVGDQEKFLRYSALDARSAPTNTPGEFLAFCGIFGLGRLVAEGRTEHLVRLRAAASDSRWRVREAAAMALQTIGDANVASLLAIAADWGRGTPLEMRAAAAGVCEPRLLRQSSVARQVLALLDSITGSVAASTDRHTEEFRVLRQGLAYCWSVAVAAFPEAGKPAMEKWLGFPDPEVQWIMRENLKKRRLARMDADWVGQWQAAMTGRSVVASTGQDADIP